MYQFLPSRSDIVYYTCHMMYQSPPLPGAPLSLLSGQVPFDRLHGTGEGRLLLTCLLLLLLTLFPERVGVRVLRHDVDDVLLVRVDTTLRHFAVFTD